jgi:alanine racemase
MDYTTVDVGHIRDASVGDVVTVIGRDGDEEIRVEDVATAARTIPYEVTCRLSRRVVRVYSGEV